MKGKTFTIGLVILGLMTILSGCDEPQSPVPSSPEELCDQGWQSLMDRDTTSANASFSDALELNGYYANGWNGLGWCSITNSDTDGAFGYFSKAKQTVGDPLALDTVELQNLQFRFYMDAYFGAGLTAYLAQDYEVAIQEFETASAADSEADDPVLGDYSADDLNYAWNYVNWYIKDGNSYALTTWHVHLYAALSYLKADRNMNKAVAHINLCRDYIGESTDFTAGDWAEVNAEIGRLLPMNPDPQWLDYPVPYPNF